MATWRTCWRAILPMSRRVSIRCRPITTARWLTRIQRSRLFFNDLPEVHRRRKERHHNQVLDGNNARQAARITICRISITSPAAG